MSRAFTNKHSDMSIKDMAAELYAYFCHERIAGRVSEETLFRAGLVAEAAAQKEQLERELAECQAMLDKRMHEEVAGRTPLPSQGTLDVYAIALWDANSKNYRNRTAWADLHPDTRQLWRDAAAKRISTPAPQIAGERQNGG